MSWESINITKVERLIENGRKRGKFKKIMRHVMRIAWGPVFAKFGVTRFPANAVQRRTSRREFRKALANLQQPIELAKMFDTTFYDLLSPPVPKEVFDKSTGHTATNIRHQTAQWEMNPFGRRRHI